MYLFNKCSHLNRQRLYCRSSAHDNLATAYKYCDTIADIKYGIDPTKDLETGIEKMRMLKVKRDIYWTDKNQCMARDAFIYQDLPDQIIPT